MIIDGMMHLEMTGSYWDGLIDEIIEHYDAVGIDKGVVLTTWTPSRESNDRTREACRMHPDRFIPFGHVRVEDEWEDELKRITQEFGWTGLKLHKDELKAAGFSQKDAARRIVEKAADLGIRLVKIHLVDYEAIEELTREITSVTWILPHLGCYWEWDDMQKYCELARQRENVYLDTSGVATYYQFGNAFEWAGVDKITFASDGFGFSPLVELAKIRTLQLPTPYRTPRLTNEDMDKILGKNMARLLGL